MRVEGLGFRVGLELQGFWATKGYFGLSEAILNFKASLNPTPIGFRTTDLELSSLNAQAAHTHTHTLTQTLTHTL